MVLQATDDAKLLLPSVYYWCYNAFIYAELYVKMINLHIFYVALMWCFTMFL